MKKTVLFLIALLLCYQRPVLGAENTPSVAAQGAVLMDMESGRVLWEKNAYEPMAMASTTKIMTAWMALTYGNLDDVVVASKRAAAAPQVKMGLSEGEEHTLLDLLYPLMLQSSNDAAIAIAEHLGGSVEDFCAWMTEEAKKMGAKDTLFVTPNGLDAGDHHSTAYDMALITREALKNEKFVEIINTKEVTIPLDPSREDKQYAMVNKNRLLSEYEGAIGVKTGFTGKAGQCFVGAAERDGMTLISVVFASGWGTKGKEQKWIDTKRLLNYGFETFEKVQLAKQGDVVQTVQVLSAKTPQVSVAFTQDVWAPLTEEERSSVRMVTVLPDTTEAPVEQGQILGEAFITINGQPYATVELAACSSIERHDFKTNFQKIFYGWLHTGMESIF